MFTDPFGLCPPDDLNPCSASDYWAVRSATGQGNQVVNNVMGTLASCGESFVCNLVLDVASLGAASLERAGARAAESELTASAEAHAAQESAAAAGKSWTTQRRAFWKAEAASEDAAERWGADNVGRMEKGLAPKIRNPKTGAMESVELHHDPVPKRAGGTQVRPVTPDEHRAVDVFRN